MQQWKAKMLKLQHELGVCPVNVYMDRPSEILGQLSSLNIKFFVVGQYDGPMPLGFNRVNKITPDVCPNIVLSQTKLENFNTLRSIARDYKAQFVHYETNLLPNIKRGDLDAIKNERAGVNVFSCDFVARHWEFDETECVVIEPGLDDHLGKVSETGYCVSTNLPLSEMIAGACPIVFKTPYTSSIIKNMYNGILYSSQEEIKFILNKLKTMDKEDIGVMGKNAQKTVIERFPKDKFLNSWAKLIERII